MHQVGNQYIVNSWCTVRNIKSISANTKRQEMEMSACSCAVASKQHICKGNWIEISRAFSMACQVYYEVRFRIDVVRFWLHSKHILDPSVEKTYCVVTKHWERTGSTYFLALCLYTKHLFHIQPRSPPLPLLHSVSVRIHCTSQQKKWKTNIFSDFADEYRLTTSTTSSWLVNFIPLKLCSLSLSLSFSHTSTCTHATTWASFLLNYDVVVWNLFQRGWCSVLRLLLHRWIHSACILYQPNNHAFIAHRLTAIDCEEQSLSLPHRTWQEISEMKHRL